MAHPNSKIYNNKNTYYMVCQWGSEGLVQSGKAAKAAIEDRLLTG
jgi:hypothetical protein